MSQQPFDNTQQPFENADHHAAQPGNIHAPSSLLPTVLSRLGLDDEHGEQNSSPSTSVPTAVLRHAEWHVRAAAVRTIEKMGAYAPLEPLLMALEDEHPSVRAAAAHALGNMGASIPLAHLRHALNDSDWHVRETALLALTASGLPIAGEALQTALRDPDAAVRETARQVQRMQQAQQSVHIAHGAQQDSSFTTHTLHYPWRHSARHKGAQMHKNDLYTREFEQTIRSSGTEKQPKKQSGWKRVSRSLAISAAIVFVLANIVAWSVIAQRAHPASTQLGGNRSGVTPPVATPTLPPPSPTPTPPVITPTTPASQTAIGKTVYIFHSQYGAPYSLAWSPDGKRIASGTTIAQVWDATTGGDLFTYNPNNGGGSVLAIAWSPDGQRIASGSGNAQVWNPSTGNLDATYPQGSQASAASSSVASASAATSTGNISELVTMLNPVNQQKSLSGGNMIYALAWAPNGKYIASALYGAAYGYGYNVQIWDAATGKHILTYSPYTNPTYNDYVDALAWSPDGKYIASGGADKLVYVWEAATGHLVTTYKGHSGSISSLSWSPDGSSIASGSADGTVQVWNPMTGTRSLTYSQQGGVSSLAWSHDGMSIASGGSDVQIWSAISGKHIYTYSGHGTGTYIRAVAWSPNDKLIASGSNNETGGDVRVWSA